jgi:DNA-directed RNA polymerase specialized sigma24 family protein
LEPTDRRPERPATRDDAHRRRADVLGERLSDGCDAVILEDLYDAYGASCYRLAHRMVTDEQLASTIVRDVYLAVWTGTVAFDAAQGSVQTWLLRDTHHRAVLTLRRQRQLRSAASTEMLAVVPQPRTTGYDLLELAYFGGHTQLEVASLTGTALGTIKTLALQALRQLRNNRELLEGAIGEDLRHNHVATEG